jgi:hypothetical protein
MLQRAMQTMTSTVIYSGLGAGCGTAAMAVGSEVFKAAQYSGYDVGRAAAAGAVGSAVLSGGFGLVAGLMTPAVDEFSPCNLDLVGVVTGSTASLAQTFTTALVVSSLGSVVGAAILTAAGHDSMAVDRLFAAATCGSYILAAGFALAMLPALMFPCTRDAYESEV